MTQKDLSMTDGSLIIPVTVKRIFVSRLLKTGHNCGYPPLLTIGWIVFIKKYFDFGTCVTEAYQGILREKNHSGVQPNSKIVPDWVGIRDTRRFKPEGHLKRTFVSRIWRTGRNFCRPYPRLYWILFIKHYPKPILARVWLENEAHQRICEKKIPWSNVQPKF